MQRYGRRSLLAWGLAFLVTARVSGTRTPMVAGAPPSSSDSVVIRSLGILPKGFSDRFITELESVRDSSDIHPQTGRRIYSSPDGLHVAFRLDLVTSQLMVADGVRGDEHRFVSRGVYSREGGHFAYFASPSEEAGPSIVIDEHRVVPGYYAAGPLTLSADGRHWAFVGREQPERGRPSFVVSDRGTGAPYDAVNRVTLSWNGERIGYVARTWDDWYVVIDDVRSPRYDQVTAPVFDLSGKHCAYGCRRDDSWYVVRDGEAAGPYVTLDTTSVRWNRDGSRLAYVAGFADRQSMLFVNGDPGMPWHWINVDSTCFSPDGAHTLYAADGQLVLDGRVVEPNLSPSFAAPTWSADGEHLIYTESVWERSRVVRDGVAGPDYATIETPRLSADGSRLAFSAREGDYHAMVVDGVMGPNYRSVGIPAFSPEGRHVAYFARPSEGRAFVVIDGRRGPEFEWVPRLGPTYLPDGSLQYLAVRKSELFRVTHVPRRTD